jgi:hypothetical protein
MIMTILEIIALVANVAPKVIGAGKSIMDIWNMANAAITGAKDGVVDPDAAARLHALVTAQLDALQRNADEAKDVPPVA